MPDQIISDNGINMFMFNKVIDIYSWTGNDRKIKADLLIQVSRCLSHCSHRYKWI